ncbi:MAG: hypothetical protein R2783_08035 [Gelidibacter sp.]
MMQGQDFVATVQVTNLKMKCERYCLDATFPSRLNRQHTICVIDFGDTTTSQARYTDIRDDRVNFYFDLSGRGKYDTKNL